MDWPTIAYWLRKVSPAFFGAALVLMVRGHQYAALAAAVLFFVFYAGLPRRRPSLRKQPLHDETEGGG
jgi:hypothetical protein